MRKASLLIVTALTAAVAFSVPATAKEKKEGSEQGTKADNAEKNKEYKSSGSAEQQSGAQSDREITRRIRRAIVKDKSLSVKAHNVKIITRNGEVTLRGPVNSEEEKTTVEKAAKEAMGTKGKITNDLKVAEPKSK